MTGRSTDISSLAQSADGRRRRSERTRAKLVEATIALLEEGVVWPSADQLAERAGVARRSIFRLYGDMESVYFDLAKRQAGIALPVLTAAPPPGSTEERVQALVKLRLGWFEQVAPVRRAAHARRYASPILDQTLRASWLLLRRQVEAFFQPELEHAPKDTVEILDALLSFETWDRLRTAQGLGVRRTRKLVTHSVLDVLAPQRRVPPHLE